MEQIFDAIYEDGVLKPLKQLDIKEHERVRVSIEVEEGKPLSEPIKKIFEYMESPVIATPEEMAKSSEIDID